MSKKFKKLVGSEYSDTLTALGNGNSALYGMGGNDLLKQSQESLKYINSMYGGSGDDEISFQTNTKVAHGEDGNDRVVGQLASKQKINGGTGDDFINTDVFYAGKLLKNIVIDAGDGDDIIDYWNNSDTKTKNIKVYGGSGNDKFYLRPLRENDNTYFDLGSGDDTVLVSAVPQSRDMVIYGGDGFDVLDLSGGWDRQNYWGLTRDANGLVSAKWANYVDKNGVRYEQIVRLPGFEAIKIDSLGVIPFSNYPDLPLA